MQTPPSIDEKFFSHLQAEDELGAVVRAHIHIEASIIEFLNARVPFPDELPRLQYEARLKLSTALGLKRDYFESLKLLGDIRNSFGHNINTVLTDVKLNELFSKLPQEGKDITLQAYAMTSKQRGEEKALPFVQLAPRDRFTLIAVMLKSYVVAAAHEASTKNAV